MASARRRIASFSSVTSPENADGEPGPREGMALDEGWGSPSSRPSALTSSLNSSRSGSISLSRMRSGSPPTLWCDLMVADGPPEKDDALDHVGIERALGEEVDLTDLLASSSNTSTNSRPMILRLSSGSVTPRSPARKRAPASTATSGML